MSNDLMSRLKDISTRIYKLFGRSEFVNRLHDFLVHEGRRTKVDEVERTSKVALEIEKQSLKNKETIVTLMKAANFSDKKIQEAIMDNSEIERVYKAIHDLRHYIDDGSLVVLDPVNNEIGMPKNNLFMKERPPRV